MASPPTALSSSEASAAGADRGLGYFPIVPLQGLADNGPAQDVIVKLLRIRFTWASRAGRLAGDATTPATIWIRYVAVWTKNVLFVF
jgi:hypothetical protein